jgi:hypothetical protein
MFVAPPSHRQNPSIRPSHHPFSRVEVTHFPTAMIAMYYAVEKGCCGERVVVESSILRWKFSSKSRVFSVGEGQLAKRGGGPCTAWMIEKFPFTSFISLPPSKNMTAGRNL